MGARSLGGVALSATRPRSGAAKDGPQAGVCTTPGLPAVASSAGAVQRMQQPWSVRWGRGAGLSGSSCAPDPKQSARAARPVDRRRAVWRRQARQRSLDEGHDRERGDPGSPFRRPDARQDAFALHSRSVRRVSLLLASAPRARRGTPARRPFSRTHAERYCGG